ncbi:MAG: right-handed parallel beta-helix repeat-containing protein, partial [Bdellovibrionales bacterium]|nr:right-handed parallel beta-helix repeat-containing protein [Bdellovibrionales bacterium]
SSTGIELSVAKEFAVDIGLTMVAATKGLESGVYCVSEILPVSFKSDSTQEGYCGDGQVQTSLGEQCDDGNNDSGDACSATCQDEIPTSDDITVSLKATRTSGVAPLAIHFDATGTVAPSSSSTPFSDLMYSWDFGDPNSGNWSINGKSRNSASGPVAGHLYEEAGDYTVRLSVVDQQGKYNEKEVLIHVIDADQYFSGSNTVCASTSGNFSGCPDAGAQKVTTSSFGTAMSYLGNGKRVLLRRGEVFSTSGTSISVTDTAMIGAFGSGTAKPRIELTSSGIALQLKNVNTQIKDIRIVDLEFDGNSSEASKSIAAESSTKYLTILRTDMHDFGTGLEMASSVLTYWNNNGYPQAIHSGFSLVESSIIESSWGGAYLEAKDVTFLGNRLYNYTVDPNEHIIRTPFLDNAVFSNNSMGGGSFQKHVFKMHGPTYSGGTSSVIPAHSMTQNVLVSDNEFYAGRSQWAVVPGPQNSIEDERLRNILIERNSFRASNTSIILLRQSGNYATIRNNVFNLTGGIGGQGIHLSKRGADPAPEHARIYNNTFYRADSGVLEAIYIAGDAIDAVARNNLAAGPFATSPKVLVQNYSPSTTADHNLLSDNPKFVANAPVSALNFQLKAGSPAIDAGAPVANLEDYNESSRPINGDGTGAAQYDIGAFEFAP